MIPQRESRFSFERVLYPIGIDHVRGFWSEGRDRRFDGRELEAVTVKGYCPHR